MNMKNTQNEFSDTKTLTTGQMELNAKFLEITEEARRLANRRWYEIEMAQINSINFLHNGKEMTESDMEILDLMTKIMHDFIDDWDGLDVSYVGGFHPNTTWITWTSSMLGMPIKDAVEKLNYLEKYNIIECDIEYADKDSLICDVKLCNNSNNTLIDYTERWKEAIYAFKQLF